MALERCLCYYYYFYLINCFSNFLMFTFLRYSSSKPTPSTNLQYADKLMSLLVAISSRKSFSWPSHFMQIAASISIVIFHHQSITFFYKKIIIIYLLNLLKIASRLRIWALNALISDSMGAIFSAAFARASITSGSLS